MNRVFRHLHVADFQTVLFHLLRDEVLLHDRLLFHLGVAADRDDFHTIKQWTRNVVQVVRGQNEHHFRNVVIDFEVVVAERLVLLWVQDLKQSGRRVATEVVTHLVDFVEQEDWVRRTSFLERLDDFTGQRADVSAAVTTNLCFVTNAAE